MTRACGSQGQDRDPPTGRTWSDDEEARPGRHPAYPDPLPPLEGPMPGGGPSPAETTLPLALKWPAPPARPPRTPRFTPHPSGPGGPAARRPRGLGARPAPRKRRPAGAGCPGRPSTGREDRGLGTRSRDTGRAARAGPPGPRGPARPGGPAADRAAGGCRGRREAAGQRADQRSSLVRSSAGMAVGTLVSRGTGFLRTLVLVVRDRRRRAQQRVQQRQHPAEHRLLPHARRHLHQRGRAAAGPGGPARPGPRRGLRAADVHPRRGGPARGHRGGDAAGGPAGRPVRADHPRPRRAACWAPSTT